MKRLKKVYYGPTTFQQRQYLMQVYQNTGNVTEACRVAKVSRGTFFRWHPRFKEQGEAVLQDCLSQAPHRPHRVKEELALQKELQELHIQQEELRQEGRKFRKARKEQDQAWRTKSQQRKKALQERQKLSRKRRRSASRGSSGKKTSNGRPRSKSASKPSSSQSKSRPSRKSGARSLRRRKPSSRAPCLFS